MLRLKRPLVWLLMVALVVTMFPGKFTPLATAATATTTYFSPDDLTLRNTISLSQDIAPAGDPSAVYNITRESVFKTNNPNFTITGTYAQVTASTMKVTVQQITQSGSKWVTDAAHTATGAVTTDTMNPDNRFIASGLTLFTGFNKVTLSGMQGSMERSESFYVLYDKVPYVTSLQVLGGGPAAINLNEGTKVVVPNQQITLQGNVTNATKVGVSLNGGSSLQTSLLEDGTFFTPALTLKSGENTLEIVVQNAADSITIKRSVYYFDTNKPFTDLYLTHDGKAYNILGNIPTLTLPATTGNLMGQVLLPYSASIKSFEDDHTVTINGQATSVSVLESYTIASDGSFTVNAGTSPQKEIVIPAPDGVTPQYRLITFQTTTPFTLTAGSSSEIVLAIKYGSYTTSVKQNYKYLPGETVINNIYYLSGHDGSAKNVANLSKLALNGAQVDKPDFYIMVESSANPTNTLVASYLPLGASLKLELQTNIGGLTGAQAVYKVVGFSTGQQKVKFQYSGSQSFFNADIAYVSKNYIYVANLNDGQTYTFDSSSNSNTMTLSGEYIGFENIANAQFFVNGISNDKLDPPITSFAPTVSSPKFSFTLPISASGPLVYGENKLVFTGTSMDNAGNKREIRKELRIYIVDTNVSNIKQFHPALSKGRASLTHDDLKDYTDTELNNILGLTSEFIYKDEKFVTSQTSYDLVIRGGAASKLNLYQGSDLFLSLDNTVLTGTPARKGPTAFTYNKKTYYYDFAGGSTDFILRIMDIPAETAGSVVYNLELVNNTGARTNQRMEVQREVAPYRILSPVTTVGEQIVVNKNFVRFDIEAEGATKVMIDKFEAVQRTDLPNRFTLDYVGLKPDKATAIKIQIVRADSTLNDTISVYYASAVQVDTQYMAEKVATKYSVFNKQLELSFPKGTVMKGYTTSGAAKYYPDTKLLFGIADPADGVVERKNDYGNTINVDADARTPGGLSTLLIPADLVLRFNSTVETNNFSRVSDIYWLSGGLGEKGVKGTATYKPGTNGVTPYSTEGNFTQIEAERKIVPSERGELTLKFNQNVVDEVGTTITVFRYTDAGQWENIGGEVDTKSHTITVPFDQFGYYTVMKLRRGYTDITNHPWARNILNGLYSKGIMKNLRFDQFGADDTTTRGEFATLLVKGLNIPLDYDTNKQTFFDIVPEAVSATWNFKTIETAARAGIVTGLSDGFFGPDQALTREQAAVMIARALKLKMNANNDKLTSSLSKSFVDVGSMDYYSRPAVEAVSKAKIMEGSAVTVTGQSKPVYNFNPKGKLTRAEAGKISVALLQKSTSIFPKTFN
ncbi:S-layer homology domain-containing protein [Paenibacillus tepidiphilus]|uniref:S-layer homology domain-containing protein n=1 Tax=Paenibacillus tepidiphilus TaxID=2608683 RepID=UPI00123A7699|nr:S-layer homology domain-containing protein [Paenibacillus tepidiphilus]